MTSLVAPLASLFIFSGFALAQILAPDCSPSLSVTWDWSFNTLDQNPCTVAAYLISTCNDGSYIIPALPPGYTYLGPDTLDGSHPCKCSTVAYSLLSACGGCQGEAWLPWLEYATNCSETLPFGSFPNPVPSGTRVPQWALLDVTSGNDWSDGQSLIVGDTPEISPGALLGPSGVVTGTVAATATGAQPPYGTSAVSVTFGDSPTALSGSSSTGGSSSNTGAIVGGVVGGVAVISIAITAIFFSMRRQRPQAPTATPSGTGVSQLPKDEFQRPLTDKGMHTASTLPGDPVVSTKHYDPSDPTTFPGHEGVPQSPDTPQGPEPVHNGTLNSLATMQTPRTGGYHGLPIV